MSQKFSHGFRILQSALQRRTFLLRLFATTMLVAFLPTSIACMNLVTSESQRAYENSMAQLESTAATVMVQFENMISSLNSINMRLMTASELYENVIGQSVQTETDALKLIGSFHIMLPFVRGYALYLPEQGIAYSNDGKLQKNGLTRFVAGITEAELDAIIAQSDASGSFAARCASNGSMLYVAPMRLGSAIQASRYGVYIISSSLFQNYMHSALTSTYQIYSIRDSHGNLIYQDEALAQMDAATKESDYITCSVTGARGYTIEVCAARALIQQSLDSVAQNVHLLVGMNVILCAVLIILVLFYNYQPLARLVKKIGSRDAGSSASELDSVLHSYTALAHEKGKLNVELYEKNLILADKLLENLLRGQELNRSDLRLLQLHMPYYRVICAPLHKVHNICDIIERNAVGSPIYAIEMYMDGVLAFVCGLPDDSQTSLEKLLEAIRALVANADVPLGYSPACASPEMLFAAYRKAKAALPAEENSTGDAVPETSALLVDDSPETQAKLTNAMKCGNDFMVRFADASLRAIAQQNSAALRRYGLYQLSELYRRIGQTVDMPFNAQRLAGILTDANENAARENLLSLIAAAREERAKLLEQQTSAISYELTKYIGENFTDSLFGLNELADRFGVSVYTASRMVKTLTGINFKKYLGDLRIERAKDLLLSTEMSVADVAQRSGFSSTSYFIKVFKESEGTTPSRFRSEG